MPDVLTTVKPIFRYVVPIERREFDVVIASDGMSYWNDLTKCSLMGQIRDDRPAFGISLSASKEILIKASEMVHREYQERKKIGFKSPSISLQMDIAEMDVLLRDFFWRNVEPRLNQNSGLIS
jgi:hypothetical protein